MTGARIRQPNGNQVFELDIDGFPECWFAWHHQLTSLADAYHCVALDLKGYGQSDHRPEGDDDYAAQAAELPAVFDALGLDRFFLVAHDRGAVIADHLCAVPPGRSRPRPAAKRGGSSDRHRRNPHPPRT
jgi:alpha-beta hydrolase superfamily lysophospholipase